MRGGHGLYSCALCGLRGVGLLPGTDGSIVAEATGRNPAIASRGIDVDDITLVINFDMPIDPELYVHRVSRTARAGASGAAVSFCDLDERGQLPAGVRIESRFSRRFRRSKAGGRSR